MPDEHRTLQLERVENREHIVAERIGARGQRRKARLAETAAGDAVDMKIAGELGREVVEDVRRVASTWQQHERPSCAAPIEHLQVDVLGYRNESAHMR